jgi:hypothetical protein
MVEEPARTDASPTHTPTTEGGNDAMTTTPDTTNMATAIPFAGDATAVLRGAVYVARREAKARGQTRGRVATSIGNVVDALTPGFPLEGLGAVTIEADPNLARVLVRAEARARASGADTITLAHLRDTLESRLRYAGTSIARLGYARYRLAKVAAGDGAGLGTLASRSGDGDVVLAGAASTSPEGPRAV